MKWMIYLIMMLTLMIQQRSDGNVMDFVAVDIVSSLVFSKWGPLRRRRTCTRAQELFSYSFLGGRVMLVVWFSSLFNTLLCFWLFIDRGFCSIIVCAAYWAWHLSCSCLRSGMRSPNLGTISWLWYLFIAIGFDLLPIVLGRDGDLGVSSTFKYTDWSLGSLSPSVLEVL